MVSYLCFNSKLAVNKHIKLDLGENVELINGTDGENIKKIGLSKRTRGGIWIRCLHKRQPQQGGTIIAL